MREFDEKKERNSCVAEVTQTQYILSADDSFLTWFFKIVYILLYSELDTQGSRACTIPKSRPGRHIYRCLLGPASVPGGISVANGAGLLRTGMCRACIISWRPCETVPPLAFGNTNKLQYTEAGFGCQNNNTLARKPGDARGHAVVNLSGGGFTQAALSTGWLGALSVDCSYLVWSKQGSLSQVLYSIRSKKASRRLIRHLTVVEYVPCDFFPSDGCRSLFVRDTEGPEAFQL